MHILYVVNNAAFFVSHRLQIALAARERGDNVALITGMAGSETMESQARAELDRLHVEHRCVSFRSAGTNPFVELYGLSQVVREVRRRRPTIIHCASPKGLLMGGLAARITGVPGLVLAVSGQGHLYSGTDSWSLRLLRSTYSAVVREAYRHGNKRVVVQNDDDRSLTVKSGYATEDEVILIPGSGVDLEQYTSLPPSPREKLVVLPARLLRDKGVYEFVAAAEQLRMEGLDWRFALVGTADYQTPAAVSEATIGEWQRKNLIEWWGHCQDMREAFGRAQIVCLPSYREGMPKALLEAAAAGCAVVTTDAVGCRDAIEVGETGDLVPVGDAVALTDALRRLISDEDRIKRYAAAGRTRAIEKFDIHHVVRRTLRMYDDLASASSASSLPL